MGQGLTVTSRGRRPSSCRSGPARRSPIPAPATAAAIHSMSTAKSVRREPRQKLPSRRIRIKPRNLLIILTNIELTWVPRTELNRRHRDFQWHLEPTTDFAVVL